MLSGSSQNTRKGSGNGRSTYLIARLPMTQEIIFRFSSLREFNLSPLEKHPELPPQTTEGVPNYIFTKTGSGTQVPANPKLAF